MKRILSFILIIIMLASCTKQEVSVSSEQLQQYDSLALRVAVMPTLSCLPLYYAEHTGMLANTEHGIKLLRYQAQMDIDTAIIGRHADVAFTDLVRAIRLTEKCTEDSIYPLMATEEPISMVCVKGKRISKIHQMKEKMIAIARLSITDYWCEWLLDSASLNEGITYKPQINDVKLRADMLRTGLIDAAMMGEPYTSWMLKTGHIRLFQTKPTDARLSVCLTTDSCLTDSQTQVSLGQLRDIYNKALKEINENTNTDAIKHILTKDYGIPAEYTDSIDIPQICQPDSVRVSDVEAAHKWLEQQGQSPKGFKQNLFLRKH